MPALISVNRPMEPLGLFFHRLHGRCGRAERHSCAGVTPYCSLWIVGYDISCGSINLHPFPVFGVNAGARFSRPARAKGFCLQGF